MLIQCGCCIVGMIMRVRCSVYSRTSDKGPSEKRTASLQRTHSVLWIEVVTLKQLPRSEHFLTTDSRQDSNSQRHFSGHVHGGVENLNPDSQSIRNPKHATNGKSNHASVGSSQHAMLSKRKVHVVYSNSVSVFYNSIV